MITIAAVPIAVMIQIGTEPVAFDNLAKVYAFLTTNTTHAEYSAIIAPEEVNDARIACSEVEVPWFLPRADARVELCYIFYHAHQTTKLISLRIMDATDPPLPRRMATWERNVTCAQ